MIIIPNVPCRYVSLFPTKMDFILLHKLVDNECYRNYYLDTKDSGKYKILDAGTFELGEGLGDELLIEWAEKINASEIIIPDVYGDKEKTLERMKEFLEKCPGKYKLQAVPQGKMLRELIDCLDEMCKEPRVTTIGYNKLWDRHCMLNPFFNKHLNEKENHLLGVNSLKEWALLSDTKSFRSADSRILTKIVTGKDDPWEAKLEPDQLLILRRLIEEVEKW